MQTQTRTFEDVLRLEEDRAQRYFDVDQEARGITPALSFHESGVVDEYHPARLMINLPNAGTQRFDFGRYGQDQFFQKVGIPIVYARKCLRTSGMDHELLSDIDGWLKRSDETWKFRCSSYRDRDFGSRVRGVVSERYVPFDNVDLLKALEPIVRERDLQIQSLRQDDGHMNLRLLMPKPIEVGDFVDPEGSEMFAGYVVRNSEIRLAAVSVAAMVWRLICTNGLIAPAGDISVFRQIHYGQPAERVRAHLPEAIREVDRQQGVMFTAYAEASHLIFTLAEAVKIAERISKAADLNKTEIAELTKVISEDAARTLPAESEELQEIGGFTLVNAMTRYAHSDGMPFQKQDKLEAEVGRFVLSQ